MAAKKAIVSEEVQEPHELTSAKLLKMGIGRGLHKTVDSVPRGDIPMKMPAEAQTSGLVIHRCVCVSQRIGIFNESCV
jgi:hypothetical protein